LPQKALGILFEVWNVPRLVMTSFDLSAVLRQGGFIAFAHPVRALQAFPAMFKALASEKGRIAVETEIKSRANYPLYQRAKLYLSEPGKSLAAMEEAYMGRWANKIPGIAASQRAYTEFLNKLRADSFDAMAEGLGTRGTVTDAEAKAIAHYVNVATGRGNLGLKENALVGLNVAFFAPRLVASRFQLLVGEPAWRGTTRTRLLVAQEYGRFLIGLGVVYALARAAGATIEADPRSADFGKIRFGKTRIDPLAGLSQITVLLSRLATGETKTAKGKIEAIRGKKVPFGGPTGADVLEDFLRTKLSPNFGAAVNLLAGKDVRGQPVTPASTAENLLVPMTFNDIYNAMQDQGAKAWRFVSEFAGSTGEGIVDRQARDPAALAHLGRRNDRRHSRRGAIRHHHPERRASYRSTQVQVDCEHGSTPVVVAAPWRPFPLLRAIDFRQIAPGGFPRTDVQVTLGAHQAGVPQLFLEDVNRAAVVKGMAGVRVPEPMRARLGVDTRQCRHVVNGSREVLPPQRPTPAPCRAEYEPIPPAALPQGPEEAPHVGPDLDAARLAALAVDGHNGPAVALRREVRPSGAQGLRDSATRLIEEPDKDVIPVGRRPFEALPQVPRLDAPVQGLPRHVGSRHFPPLFFRQRPERRRLVAEQPHGLKDRVGLSRQGRNPTLGRRDDPPHLFDRQDAQGELVARLWQPQRPRRVAVDLAHVSSEAEKGL
jgi:hypothetical protein